MPLKPPSPELQAWLQVVSVLLTICAGIVAIYVALVVRTIHIQINSRLTQLLKTTGSEQRALGDAEGVERERTEERDRKERGTGEAS